MLIIIGVLTALHIILSRFLSINAWNIKIGLAFLATLMGAYLYGPLGGALVGGLGDFLGALLFPIGAYFPGFTLNCAMTGVVMGLLLYRSRSFKRILIAVMIDQLVISLWITSLWISVLYGSPYWPVVISRLPQIALMLVIETVLTTLVLRMMDQINVRHMLGIEPIIKQKI